MNILLIHKTQLKKKKVITVIYVKGAIAIFALDDSRVVASLAAVPSFHFHAFFELASASDPFADLGTLLSSRPPFVASAPRPSVGGLRYVTWLACLRGCSPHPKQASLPARPPESYDARKWRRIPCAVLVAKTSSRHLHAHLTTLSLLSLLSSPLSRLPPPSLCSNSHSPAPPQLGSLHRS